MYSQPYQLTEQLTIVEEISIQCRNTPNAIIIPNNQAEIYIPIDKNLELKMIGNAKSMSLIEGNAYFFMPRRRGIELLGTSDYLMIKVNPIYCKSFVKELKELSTGVYQLSINSCLIKDLISSASNNDIYQASDLLSSLIDVEEAFNYNTTILDSIEQIRSTSGTISVKEIYTSLNVSKSKLEQHFNREIGLTPKEFCKIQKINAFIELYKENTELSFTELTYRCGYYDQSHLIKDFRYFLETSPKKFFTAVGF